MFRVQREQLRGAPPSTLDGLARRIDEITQVLVGCGAMERDVGSHGDFQLYGDSNQSAGISDWFATLDVWQQNRRAGTAQQPKLLAARFRGPVKFDNPIFGVLRAATDDETGEALTVHLFANTPGKQPNIRSGATFWYFYDLDGTPRALSEDDAIGTIKMVNSTSIIPGGWVVCDGGSSTVDLIGRSPLGHATVAGTQAGSASTGSGTASISMSGALANESSHTHGSTGLTATNASHDHGGATGNTAPGLSGSTDGATATISGLTSNETVDVPVGNAVLADNNDPPTLSVVAHPGAGNVFTSNGHTHGPGTLAVDSHTHALTTASVASHNHSISSATPTITMGGSTDAGTAHTHGLGTLAATDSGHTHSFTPLTTRVIFIQRTT